MSYLGNEPPQLAGYSAQTKAAPVGSSITLNQEGTINSTLLFLDGVRQTPTTDYTISGTTLTLTSTAPTTAVATILFLGDVSDIGVPSDDTVNVDQLDTDSTGSTGQFLKKSGASAIDWATVDALPSQTSQSGKFLTTDGSDASWAVAGGNNIPQFSVYVAATWDLSDNTWTLTPYDSADVNDDGASGTCFNLTASGTNPRGFTVPAGEAGKYFLSYTVNHYSTSADMELQYVSIYKGTTGVGATEYIGNTYGHYVSSYKQHFASAVIVDAAVGDHFHVYSRNQTGDATGRVEGARKFSNFSGFKLL